MLNLTLSNAIMSVLAHSEHVTQANSHKDMPEKLHLYFSRNDL